MPEQWIKTLYLRTYTNSSWALSLRNLVSQLSSEYGISEVAIYKWIKQQSPIVGKEKLTMAEVDAMQKENLRLKQGLEILKKAMILYSRENRWPRTDQPYYKWKRTSSGTADVSCFKDA